MSTSSNYYDIDVRDVAICQAIQRAPGGYLDIQAAARVHTFLLEEAESRGIIDADRVQDDQEAMADRVSAHKAVYDRLTGAAQQAADAQDHQASDFFAAQAQAARAAESARAWEEVSKFAVRLGYPETAAALNASSVAALAVSRDHGDAAALVTRGDLEARWNGIVAGQAAAPAVPEVKVDRAAAKPAFGEGWRRHATSSATRRQERRLVDGIRSTPERSRAREGIEAREAVFARRIDALGQSAVLMSDQEKMRRAAQAVRAHTAAATWSNIATLETDPRRAKAAEVNANRAQAKADSYDFAVERIVDAKRFELKLASSLPPEAADRMKHAAVERERTFIRDLDAIASDKTLSDSEKKAFSEAVTLNNAREVWQSISDADPRENQSAVATRYAAELEQRRDRAMEQAHGATEERLAGMLRENSDELHRQLAGELAEARGQDPQPMLDRIDKQIDSFADEWDRHHEVATISRAEGLFREDGDNIREQVEPGLGADIVEARFERDRHQDIGRLASDLGYTNLSAAAHERAAEFAVNADALEAMRDSLVQPEQHRELLTDLAKSGQLAQLQETLAVEDAMRDGRSALDVLEQVRSTDATEANKWFAVEQLANGLGHSEVADLARRASYQAAGRNIAVEERRHVDNGLSAAVDEDLMAVARPSKAAMEAAAKSEQQRRSTAAMLS